MRKSKYLILSRLYFDYETEAKSIELKNTYKDFFRNQNVFDLLRFNDIINIGQLSFEYETLNFIYFSNSIIKINNKDILIYSDDRYNIKYINFSNCKNLKNICIAAFMSNNINIVDMSNCNNLEKIGLYCFYGCNIKKLKLPNNITELDNYAFCENDITIVDMSNCTKLTELSESLFRNNKLRSVKLPPNLISISDNCFDHNLISYIDLSNYSKLSSISYDVFLDNPLEEIKIQYNITISYNPNVKNDKWNQFVEYYNETNKRAGDYKYENNEWNWYPL